MLSKLQVSTVFWMILVFLHCTSAYELHDTIHSLKEENLHLQNRLENLSHALRDLKYLLTEHPKGEHDNEYLHIWKEWVQHGITAEIHQMLEQTFCLTELHNAGHSVFNTTGFLFLLFYLK